MHFKYSGIINVVYITFMYGLGLPMLFPIALLSLVIFYVVERYQIAYTYRQPPRMDTQMTKSVMSWLSYTPLLFLLNGYWMLSNLQIFENKINSKNYSTEQMQSSHSCISIFDETHTLPMAVIAFAVIVISTMRNFCYDTLT